MVTPNPAPGSARGRGGPARIGRGLVIGVAVVIAASTALVALHVYSAPFAASGPSGVILVVAAENFWGSLVAQLGGSHVSVFSIVTDPNADPHEYESNTADAVEIANAKIVIENGAGYDDWCQQLVTADGSSSQLVVNVASVLGKVAGDNPHFWYGAAYVNATIRAMYGALASVDPAHMTYYQQQYATLNTSMAPMFHQENDIRSKFGGTPVASTESIFVYMANSTGLNLISPPAFMDAVAEGNDPPASSVTIFQNQLQNGSVKVLVYNVQTVTPLTTQMQSIATSSHVPIVGVSETLVPIGLTFQAWMGGELAILENALNQTAAPH